MVGRNSVQSRLARKADNTLAYNQSNAVRGLYGGPGFSREANNNDGNIRLGLEEGRDDSRQGYEVGDSRRCVQEGGDGRHGIKVGGDVRHGAGEGGTPFPAKHHYGSPDPVLDEIVAKLKSGLQLGSNKSPSQAPTPYNKAAQQKTVANVHSLVVKQDVLAIKIPPASIPSVVGGCICFRPLKLVMCEVCGETFRARVSLVCGLHPRALYLQDVKECKGCKQTNKLALKEYDLPPGMEKGIKNVMDRKERWIGSR